MKLLIVSQYFWPEVFGINALVRELNERGMEVTVLTGKPNYPGGQVFDGYRVRGIQRERHDGVELIRVPLVPRGKRSGWRLMLNYLSFVLTGSLMGPWALRGRHFDAVFVYAPSPLLQALPAVLLARLNRAPLAIWVQDLWPESLSATGYVRNTWALSLVRHVVKFIYGHTDLVLIPSEAFRGPVRALTPARVDVRYYPNAWTPEPQADASDAAVARLGDQLRAGFSVVFAGNLGTAQALDTVLDAAQMLMERGSTAQLVLIGSGSLSGWLSEQVSARGLSNVLLPGRFAPGAMPALYEAASALLVSLRKEPIFAYTVPSKLQGYLAAGRPVIASLDGEGARVVAEAAAGVSCPAGDAAALADAVQLLASLPPEQRRSMGDNARRFAQTHFALPRLADALIEHLQQMRETRAKDAQE